MPDLSDSLTDKIQQETYGLFPIPVTKVSLPNHDQYKQQILTWMAQQSILEKHSREAICYNVAQIGETNQLLLDLPDLAQDILNAAITHNNNANKYNTNLAISESYLELHHEGAIYAPHEHSNCPSVLPTSLTTIQSNIHILSLDVTLHQIIILSFNLMPQSYHLST